jgi:hypothetical protein
MTTPRLGFPELSHGETNGEITYNDAQRLQDLLVQTVIEELNVATEPASPTHGDIYTVGAPAGWSGSPVIYDLAQYYNGSWYYYTPFEGMRLYDKDTSSDYQFNGTTWA